MSGIYDNLPFSYALCPTSSHLRVQHVSSNFQELYDAYANGRSTNSKVAPTGLSESSSSRISGVSGLFWRVRDKKVKYSSTNNLQHYLTSLTMEDPDNFNIFESWK